MEEIKKILNGDGINPWIYSTATFVIVLALLMFVRRLLWTRLAKWAGRTTATWDDMLLAAMQRPVTVLLVIWSFGIAGQSAPPLVRTHPLMVHGVKIAMIVCAVWLLERFIAVLFRSSALPEGLNVSTRALFLTIARVILFVLGVLIALDTIGVSITPILASLGIGSLAVALALQDTMGNFFSGIYILVDKPIRAGDFVKVDDVEGQVLRIGWRSTWIQTAANDVVVLPNSKVSGAQLKNFDLPNPNSSIVVGCGVAYGSDLARVETVAIEVAREVTRREPGANATFEPIVRFYEFSDSSINFNLIIQVSRFSNSAPVRHELVKALHARFIQERIEIPFPQRVVHLNQPQA